MRTVDERVAAVRSRTSRLRRSRNDRALGALAFLMLVPLVGLMGRVVAGGLPAPTESDGGLFGSVSLFGSSVGGYVLVAVVAAVIAVAITVLLMMRRRSTSEHADDTAEHVLDGNKEGEEQWQG